jgi:hypothetical protein
MRGGNHFVALFTGAFGISDKVTPGFLAEPFDDFRVLRQLDQFLNPVERISTP